MLEVAPEEPLGRLDVWVPFGLQPRLSPETVDLMGERRYVWMRAFGRLRPEATLAGARTELQGIAARLSTAYPKR